MAVVQVVDYNQNGQKLICVNGTHWLKNVVLGDNVSLDDYNRIGGGDSLFLHTSGSEDTTTEILSITKWADRPASCRELGLMDAYDLRHTEPLLNIRVRTKKELLADCGEL